MCKSPCIFYSLQIWMFQGQNQSIYGMYLRRGSFPYKMGAHRSQQKRRRRVVRVRPLVPTVVPLAATYVTSSEATFVKRPRSNSHQMDLETIFCPSALYKGEGGLPKEHPYPRRATYILHQPSSTSLHISIAIATISIRLINL